MKFVKIKTDESHYSSEITAPLYAIRLKYYPENTQGRYMVAIGGISECDCGVRTYKIEKKEYERLDRILLEEGADKGQLEKESCDSNMEYLEV